MKALMKTAFLFSLLMTVLVACKKEDDTKKDTGPTGPSGPTGSSGITGPTGSTTCRITGLTYNYSNGISTGTVSYTYDSQKRLTHTQNNNIAGSYSVYTYGSGTINIKNYNSDTIQSEGNGTLNSAGQLTQISYGVNNLTRYTYDGDGRLIKYASYSGNYADSTIYELQGGNIVKNTQANSNGYIGESTYTYYTDKPGQHAYAGSEIFSGKPYTNLVKSMTTTMLAPVTQAPSTINYTYEFDNDGKVTKTTTVSGANTNITENTYTCN